MSCTVPGKKLLVGRLVENNIIKDIQKDIKHIHFGTNTSLAKSLSTLSFLRKIEKERKL